MGLPEFMGGERKMNPASKFLQFKADVRDNYFKLYDLESKESLINIVEAVVMPIVKTITIKGMNIAYCNEISDLKEILNVRFKDTNIKISGTYSNLKSQLKKEDKYTVVVYCVNKKITLFDGTVEEEPHLMRLFLNGASFGTQIGNHESKFNSKNISNCYGNYMTLKIGKDKIQNPVVKTYYYAPVISLTKLTDREEDKQNFEYSKKIYYNSLLPYFKDYFKRIESANSKIDEVVEEEIIEEEEIEEVTNDPAKIAEINEEIKNKDKVNAFETKKEVVKVKEANDFQDVNGQVLEDDLPC